ncbi:hypothetical protein ABE425_12625 [Chryseobacterium cucumeris]|uniref:hypothetical protein n=1 Tax=Chryseobacterium cucumeris TaxID=1813611 RepID=UPI00320B6C45
MNFYLKIKRTFLKSVIAFILIIGFQAKAQKSQFNIVGNWESIDYWKSKGKAGFTKDGYVSITINGEEIDGKNFIIHGGPDNGQKGELKYKIDMEKTPIHIDFIALKDNQEKGRLLGIIVPINDSKFLMLINMNGKRPESIDHDETMTLTKIE